MTHSRGGAGDSEWDDQAEHYKQTKGNTLPHSKESHYHIFFPAITFWNVKSTSRQNSEHWAWKVKLDSPWRIAWSQWPAPEIPEVQILSEIR